MTGLYLTAKTVDRCVDVDRDSVRRWRPCRVGTFVTYEIIIVNGGTSDG